MDATAAEGLIEQIHHSDTQTVLAVTGGGSGAIAALLGVPGASRTVVEAVVPYSAAALADWLKAAPEQSCSSRTARAMAMAAYARGLALVADGRKLAGIGCTASLASDRPKHGDHRIHVAWQTERATVVASLALEKGRRTRAAEEHLSAQMVLNAIADACGLAARLPLDLLPTEQLRTGRCDAPESWQKLWSGRTAWIGQCDGSSDAQPSAVFPGAFDPLHSAHRHMAEVAGDMLGSPVAFELSVFNVDKPPLDYLEVSQRLEQFAADQTVWLTRAPTFANKAELFPGATFVVGADTVTRIAEPRYYGGSPAARDAAISLLRRQGCGFLVFGRAIGDDFRTLSQLALPDDLRAICREVPAERFREDVSSTALRKAIATDP